MVDFSGVIGALNPIGALLPTGGIQLFTDIVAIVELVTEQTLAQPLGKIKVKTVDVAAETSVAQPVTGASLLAVGLVTETALAQPLGTRLKAKAVDIATETAIANALDQELKLRAAGLTTEDAFAQPVNGLSTLAAGLATETTAVLATVRGKSLAVGIAEETTAAFGTVGSFNVAVGLAEEASLAFDVTKAKLAGAIGLALAPETAQALGRAKLLAVGPAIGASAAQGITGTSALAVGVATSAETAFAITGAKALEVGQAGLGVSLGTWTDGELWTDGLGWTGEVTSRNEHAFPVFAVVGVNGGLAEELATAFTLAQSAKLRTAGLALENTEAFPVTIIGEIIGVAGLALQSEIAFDLGRLKLQAVAPAADSVETAFALGLPAKTGTAGLAESLEIAPSVSANVGSAIGLAEAVETAFQAVVHKLYISHQGLGLATALPLETPAKVGTAAFAESLDTAFQLVAGKAVTVGQAETFATAFQPAVAKAILVPLVTSSEQAIGVTVTLGGEAGLATSEEFAQDLGKSKERQVERPEELSLAQMLAAAKASSITFAPSLEEAMAVSLQIAGQAGLAGDLATALGLDRLKVRASDEGQEQAAAFDVTLRIGNQVGMVGELAEALQIDGHAKFKTIGLATELDTALFALQFAGAMRYIALRGRMVDRVTLQGRHGL